MIRYFPLLWLSTLNIGWRGLLNGTGDNILGSAMQARIDHIHTGVSQRTPYGLCAPVVSVQKDLRDQNAMISETGIGR